MSQMQFQAPPLSKTNRFILILSLGCFIASAIGNAVGAFKLPQLLGLSGAGLSNGFVFQLLTYPFVETQLIGFLFNALLIWFIGSEIEKMWGAALYQRFLALIVLISGVTYALVGILLFNGTALYSAPLFGLSGINFALLIAYATLYPDRQLSMMLIFPMRARTFCFILIGIEAYQALFSSHLSSWAHLLAMGLSYLFIRYQNVSFIHKLMNKSFGASQGKARRGNLRIVKSDKNDPPKFWH